MSADDNAPRTAVQATLPAWDGTPLAAAGCPECGRTVRVKADGVSLYRHGPNKAPCPMSHQEVRLEAEKAAGAADEPDAGWLEALPAGKCARCRGDVTFFRGQWWTVNDDFMCPDGEEAHSVA